MFDNPLARNRRLRKSDSEAFCDVNRTSYLKSQKMEEDSLTPRHHPRVESVGRMKGTGTRV
jgi:hypothetical protein